MNWKFWVWLCRDDRVMMKLSEYTALLDQLRLARRRAARGEPGMSDEQIVEAFDGLLDHRGFEALLQILTEEQLKAMEDMMEDGADLGAMKQAAGRAEALADFKLKLLELEEDARKRRTKKA